MEVIEYNHMYQCCLLSVLPDTNTGHDTQIRHMW